MMSRRISSPICKSYSPFDLWLCPNDTCPTLFLSLSFPLSLFILIDLRYDAEEATAQSHEPAPSAAPPAPVDASVNKVKEEPGYGEEPDLAYDPSSFDVDVSGQDDQSNGNNYMKPEPEANERPSFTESSGLNLKEDG